MKKCKICEIEKEEENFDILSGAKEKNLRISSKCKECRRKTNKEKHNQKVEALRQKQIANGIILEKLIFKTKTCIVCDEEKSLFDFEKIRDSYYKNTCKKCGNLHRSERKKTTRIVNNINQTKSKFQISEAKSRFNMMAKLSGLKIDYSFMTQNWYNQLLEKQNLSCAICGCNDKKLVIDHCHKTGEIRGLLCHMCNTGLGNFNDNSKGLKKAYNYLKSFEESICF